MDGVDGLYYAEHPGSAGRSPLQRGGQGQTLWMLIVGDSECAQCQDVSGGKVQTIGFPLVQGRGPEARASGC